MEKLKRILIKLLFPPAPVIALLVPASAALLIYAFAAPGPKPAVVYLSYLLSAYATTVLCAGIPSLYRKIKTVKEENKYAVRYFSDAALRVKISLYGSLGVNVLYAALQLFLGLKNMSVWFYALAAYYLLLAIMRFFLLREARRTTPGKNRVRELYCYRICGVSLLFMNQALSVVVFYMVWQNRGFTHHYIVTIAMAAYTFTTFTMAIVNMVRYRKYNSPILSAARQVSFAAALVSMLSLETAMLNAFGAAGKSEFKFMITSATGGAVCIAILWLAVSMLIAAGRKENENERNSNP